jgi:hypothetical protein
MTIDKKKGTVVVSTAKINHFSRYGWGTLVDD